MALKPEIDYFIGSVHHVHEIPIDYDRAFYVKARDIAGGTDERLFEDYFDSQYEMLTALKPKVVGHFDLIRLLSDEPNRDLRGMKGIWERVVRNLGLIVEQGGLMEINSSALRKGLLEPYPLRSVCVEYLKLGGRLTLSDDSHGIAHVGTCFGRVFEYLESLEVRDLWTLESDGVKSQGEKTVSFRSVSLADARSSFRG
jgi:histidinol-phosphatase (PHP family)